MTTTSRSDLRSWIQGHATAEAQIRAERRGRPTEPAAAFAQLLELLSLASATLGWPLPLDPRRDAEVEAVRATWARLRALARDAP